MNGGVELDMDVIQALRWLAGVTTNPEQFSQRLKNSQDNYIEETSKKINFGARFDSKWHGDDVVAGFFSQAKSLIDNRRAFEISTASQIIPWVKQLGQNVVLLNKIPGAMERAKRMLESTTVYPDTALFELVLAGNYAAMGYEVEFIPEKKGIAKTPEFKCTFNKDVEFVVECKRLQKGKYASREEDAHLQLIQPVEVRIRSKKMSVWIDVTYKCEVEKVPGDYLLHHLSNYCGKDYEWDDEYGVGFVRKAKLNDVKNDIESNGSISFHTKLARLLKGRPLDDNYYNVIVSGRPDERDPRFISKIKNASLVTWRCVCDESLEGRSRHIKSTLAEIEKQVSTYGLGVGHVAIDIDVQKEVADKRREKNRAIAEAFEIESELVRLNIHYLVTRVEENHSWLVDETLDYFCSNELVKYVVPLVQVFPGANIFDNDLPAWYQKC